MRTKHAAHGKRQAKRPKPARWESEVTPWVIGLGLLLGYVAEMTWDGNIMWMYGGGLGGIFVGIFCDTTLFLYRRLQHKLSNPSKDFSAMK